VTPIEEATADYLLSFERLQHFGDYFVLNVSSPNTPNLRKLQDRAALDELFGEVQRRNPRKKTAAGENRARSGMGADRGNPRLIEDAQTGGDHRDEYDDRSLGRRRGARQQGGLERVRRCVRRDGDRALYRERTKVPIIASGGIMDADAALEKFDAGASLVQIYTGLHLSRAGADSADLQRAACAQRVNQHFSASHASRHRASAATRRASFTGAAERTRRTREHPPRNIAKRAAYDGRGNEIVTYIIDRNINYTNVCNVYCKFCAFYRTEKDADHYVLTHDQIDEKLEELSAIGGVQVLLQGGHHPKLGIDWYLELLAHIREKYPHINIHGFSRRSSITSRRFSKCRCAR
jgi:hypothetical protein